MGKRQQWQGVKSLLCAALLAVLPLALYAEDSTDAEKKNANAQCAERCYRDSIRLLTSSPKAQQEWVILDIQETSTAVEYQAQRGDVTAQVVWSAGNPLQSCRVITRKEDKVLYSRGDAVSGSDKNPVFFSPGEKNPKKK